MFINLTFGFGLVTLLVFAVVKFREKRDIADLGFFNEGAVKNYLFGFGLRLAMLGAAALIVYLAGGLRLVQGVEAVGFHMVPSILFLLIGWIIQGGTEEVFTRDWMLPLLGKNYGVPAAISITSVFFMAMHSQNNGVTAIPLMKLVLFGVFAALYVVQTKEPWGMHSARNWMQGNIIGVEVSGSTRPGGSLIKLTAQGNDLISGGGFGIEGSLVCTLIFGGASVYLLMRILKTKAVVD